MILTIKSKLLPSINFQTPRIIFFMLMFRLLLYADENALAVKNVPASVSDSMIMDTGKPSEIAEIYVAVVYPKSMESLFNLIIKQTVASISDEFTASTNLKIVPQYTPISEENDYNTLEIELLCQTWNNKPIVAAVIFSHFKPSFGHAIASLHNQIPVLWATGQLQAGYFDRVPLSRFEVRLDGGCYEVLRSLRSLLLTTHWHLFTVMHTTTILSSQKYKNIISQPPLLPVILPFRSDSTSNYIFRLLSDISKSTKGVIVLICNVNDAKRVIYESKKLNMMNGDFVWLWIDTNTILINNGLITGEDEIENNNYYDSRKVRHATFYPNAHNKTINYIEPPKNIFYIDYSKYFSDSFTNGDNIKSENSSNKYSNIVYTNNMINKNYMNISNKSNFKTNNSLENNKTLIISFSNKSHFMNNLRNFYNPISPKLLNKNKLDEKIWSNKLRTTDYLKRKEINTIQAELLSINEKKDHQNFSVDDKIRKVKNLKNEIILNSERSPDQDAEVDQEMNNTSSNNSKFSNDNLDKINIMENKNDVKNILNKQRHKRFTNASSYLLRKTEFGNNPFFEMKNHRFQKIVKRQAILKNKLAPVVPFMENNNSTIRLKNTDIIPPMPVGLLAVQLMPSKINQIYIKSAITLLINTLKNVISKYDDQKLSRILSLPRISCFDFFPVGHRVNNITEELSKSLKSAVKDALAGSRGTIDSNFEDVDNSSLTAKFKILNLVPERNLNDSSNSGESTKWRTIGNIIGEKSVNLDTVVWPGGDIIPISTARGSRSIFRIVTAFAPPFVMLGELDEDGQCLRGIACHRFLTSDKDNLTLLINEIERTDEDEVNVLDRLQLEKLKDLWGDMMDIRKHHLGRKFTTNCCYGLSMDLLENVAQELEFDYQLYVVADGLFGSRTLTENSEAKWTGIMADLVSGAAHLSFAPLSVSSIRSKDIDFSVPYFFSGVSFLAAPKESTDIPLFAFLLPFTPNLWIAIFLSLHLTAIAVAIYEWHSPFGLNPWGRQRSKNFGIASAFWVIWSLLCGHLVQFKAPKSWPNKFLINVWGGFSVIYIASYTANIAALIAGSFFQNIGDHHDRSLLTQRVGAPRSSAAEFYIKSSNQILWDHMQKYSVQTVGDGVQLLKNGSLDILIADTPILDYYRATDHGCKLQKIGDTINEDTYAIGMTKGFPLKDSISAVIAKYAANGYIDILQEKWYGGLPCFKLVTEMAQPRPLGVAAVGGVFLMLVLGVVIGCAILFSEHLFYRYVLPSLRKKPKNSMWKSRNVMFFSQKLYRFINSVELVSPHHAARELVHTLRQGQITSLFQKSVKRKEHEQRQQHKSKTQFFEMIQEIRRVQQEERKNSGPRHIGRPSPRKKYYRNKSPQLLLSPTGLLKSKHRHSPGRLDFARRLSKDIFRSKSSGNLDFRRVSTDINLAAGRFIDVHSAELIGRRLSHGAEDNNSPPDLNTRRASHFVFREDDSSCNDPSPSDSEKQNLDYRSSCSPRSDIRSNTLSPNLFSIPGSFFSRDIGPIAARKFTNIDTSSFKGRTAKAPVKTPKVVINSDVDEEDGSSNKRTDSVKSTDHYIEIVIPSKCNEEIIVNDQKSISFDKEPSDPEEENEEDFQVLSSIEEYDSVGKDNFVKPKIILHMPKKGKMKTSHYCETGIRRSTTDVNESSQNPLCKLERNDLLQLLQLSEKDLKANILQAIQEKEPI